MALTPLSGTLDLVDAPANVSEFVVETFRSQFRRFGYSPVAPPILERATAFLDRSGEDIRRRMYIFVDPGGEEVCLRPELTIPTARLYANRIQGRGGIFRGYYVGPVFRYDSPREGRYRQFTQAGAELIGEGSRGAADAEMMALAQKSLQACGLKRIDAIISDVGFFSALFDDSRVSDTWRVRLNRRASDPTALQSEVASSDIGVPEHGDPGRPILMKSVSDALRLIDQDNRAEVIAALMEALGVDHLGSRSPYEVADRLLKTSIADPSEPLDPGFTDALRALLEIDELVPTAMSRLEDVAGATDSKRFQELLASWKDRLVLFDAYGLGVDGIRMRLQLRRGIDYYSGFIFEIHTSEASPVSQLCAGGRYDDLVRTIGGREGTPAVGFATGVERVALELSRLDSGFKSPDVAVVIVSGGNVPEAACVRVATALRDQGIGAEIVTGHRTRYALRAALRRDIRYLAIVGEEELGRDEIILRDLARNEQTAVRIDQLSAVASGLLGRSS